MSIWEDVGKSTPATYAGAEMLFDYLAPLSQFLGNGELTEICVNEPGAVWTEGPSGWVRTEVPELSFEYLAHLVRLIASVNAKATDAHQPLLSASLPSGERVQAVIPPAVSPNTVSLTIRKPSPVDLSLDDLEASGTFSDVRIVSDDLTDEEKQLVRLLEQKKHKEFLRAAVLAKRNILFVGKTNSGKTTAMKGLIDEIPRDERLITIEDVHELTMPKVPNKVHLFYAREGESEFNVSSNVALASCLRMRPDRIILSEIRGNEAWDFVKSISTGHPGSISSMHASGAYEAFEQMTAFIKDSETGRHLETAYIKHRLMTTIDVIMFFVRRRVREVYYEPANKRKKMAQ